MNAVASLLPVPTVLALVVEVQAHGGGLNVYGCHHDGKRGGYHCHRGPLAGQAFVSKKEIAQVFRGREATPPPRREPGPRMLLSASKP